MLNSFDLDHAKPFGLGCGSVIVDLLLIVTPIVEVLIVVCFVVRYFTSILVLQSS